jgi:hypothetical protein
MTRSALARNHLGSGVRRLSIRTAVLRAALAFALLAAGLRARRAHADDVLAGIDLFATEGCGSHADFSPTPIPANFFDPGSDPFAADVPLTGEPLNTVPANVIDPVDTIVERLAQATLPLVCGPADTVPIEIQALRLVSCNPVTVTYNGGMMPEQWDVAVSLSATFPQQSGSITISHDCAEGGSFSATLPVIPQFVFTRLSDSATRTLDLGIPMFFNTPEGHWTHSDPGFGVVTAPPGVLVDRNGDGIVDPPPLSGTTNFFPGLRHASCSCAQDPAPPGDYCRASIEDALTASQVASPPMPPGADSDADGVPDNCDSCPSTPNPDQADGDDNTVGDACESSVEGAFLDHFKCYRANNPGSPRTVTLADEFLTTTARVQKTNRFCNPVNKNGEGMTDATGHLMCHRIRDTARFVPRDVPVRNQFGDQTVRVIRGEAICNPAEKNGVPLSPAAGAFLDHFKCYKARTRGFAVRTVTLADQFTTVDSTVLKLQAFCTPVDKDGSGIKQPDAHLVCYKIKDATEFVGETVTVEDQFGTFVIKARAGGCHKPLLLCVPTEINTSPQAGGDHFGDALASCDFNGDGFDDLAVGVPDEDVGAAVDAGAVNVLYGGAGGLTGANSQFLHQDSPDVEGTAAPGNHFGKALAAGDFNHDGFCDLAVGIPGQDCGAIVDAGAVQVLYGSPAGLSAANDQVWDQDTTDVEGSCGTEDHFGSALAAADFDADGFADLAIGVPDEDVGSVVDAGAVNVLYGSAGGLSAANDQVWDQNSANISNSAEEGDHFGSALGAGDFNGDGFADLAVGVPDEDAGSIVDAGAVNVLYGRASGLSSVNSQFWDQNSPGIDGVADEGDRFGSALAAGDFSGDGFADLAIGVPGEDVGSIVDAGAVNVLYGTRTGLSYLGDQLWDRNKVGIDGDPGAEDHFGSALAAGDFDHDGFADLAVGVPDDDVGAIVDAGAVNVLYGSRSGLTATGSQLWHQDRPNVEDSSETGDHFGSALTAGDFNDDTFADPAIGVPAEDVGAVVDAGAVNVLYGAASGVSDTGNQLWDQSKPGVDDDPE